MIRKQGLWSIFLVTVLVGIGLWWQTRQPQQVNIISEIQCQPTKGDCIASFAGGQLIWLVKDDIKYMQKFEHVIELSKNTTQNIQNLSIEFVMQGMQMAANQSVFIKHSDGVWKSQSVLPVCVSGRKDWLAVVKIESAQGQWQTGFKFTIEK